MFFFSFLQKNGSFGVKFAQVGKMTPSTFDPFDLGGGGRGHGMQEQICHILTPS